MPDIHDAAQAWAQANPSDPRAKDIMAKAWAAQNPSDPRAGAILQRLNASGAPPRGPAGVPSVDYDAVAADGLIPPGAVDEYKSGRPGAALLQMAAPETALAKMAAGAVGGAGVGALQPSQDAGERVAHAGVGGLVGAAVPAAFGLAGAAGRVGTTLKQTAQMMNLPLSGGPAALSNAASEGMEAAANGLRTGAPQQTLAGLLGKADPVEIDPSQLMGHSQDLDSAIASKLNLNPADGLMGAPSKAVPVPATDLNDWRKQLDALSEWKDHNPQSLATAQSSAPEDIKAAANYARQKLHDISPEVKEAFGNASDAFENAKILTKQKAPVNWLTGQTPDRMAQIQNISQASGTGLSDLADTMRGARRIANSPLGLGSLMELPAQGIKGFGNAFAPSVNPGSSLYSILGGDSGQNSAR